MDGPGRIPPQSLEAERSVLGTILVYPRTMDQAAGQLRTDDFFLPAHRDVWDAMLELTQRKVVIDPISMADVLTRRGTVPRIEGGTHYLDTLTLSASSPDIIEHHVGIVLEKSLVRQALAAASETLAQGYGDYGDFEEYMAAVEARGFLLAQRRSVATSGETLAELIGPAFERIEARQSRPREVTGVPSGIRPLDVLTMGFQPKTLVVLAARPGEGKTALALNVCTHAALEHQIPCLIFSLEMAKESLVERMLAGVSRVPGEAIKRGSVTRDQWGQLYSVAERLRTPLIKIHDARGRTVHQIASQARLWRADPRFFPEQGAEALGLVVVDYLQLVPGGPASAKDTRDIVIGRITSTLHGLAQDLRMPILLLSQLNREGVKDGKQPTLDALMASSSIANDADIVLFIHRKTDDLPENKRWLIVEKHREGATGALPVTFRRDITRFEQFVPDPIGNPYDD